MSDANQVKEYSGKRVVVGTILFFVIFTILMGYGTFALARYLTPILREKNRTQPVKAANAPSPSDKN
jgi:hypothetical protein